jgi:16S rRNA (cytosine1402-N4)-methyltransferase
MTAAADTTPRAKPRTTPGGHVPVMLREVIDALAPRDGALYVDGTFGAGGYSAAILKAAKCTVWGIDRDSDAVAAGAALVAEYGGRLSLIEGRFGVMDELLGARGVTAVDGIALDLGVSSMQLDQGERGFSFAADGPLDMRMEPGGAGPTAADVVNTMPEADLADIIFRYGDERRSRHVAHAIARFRGERPITRTGELAAIVRKAIKPGGKGGGRGASRIDAATRTFQALRIYVNDEIGEIGRGLNAAERLLAPGGRLAVVSFHSLEDRAVKDFLRVRSGDVPGRSRHLPEAPDTAPGTPTFQPLFRGTCRPSRAECAANARARSARMRAAIRNSAPAWSDAAEAGAA